MEALQNDYEVGWDICVTRKIGHYMREVWVVLLTQLSAEGCRVYQRTLALLFIIDIHDEVSAQRELG